MKLISERTKIKRVALEKLDKLVKEAISVFNDTGDESFLHDIKPPNEKYFTKDEYYEIHSNLSTINESLDGLQSYCRDRDITSVDKII